MAEVKLVHNERCDVVTIDGNASFRVWWVNGRPFEFRVTYEGNLNVDQMRAFVAWCDAQPAIREKK